MLSSSTKNGLANIETASLDGEKNLKQRFSFEPTIGEFTDSNIVRFHSRMTCENPNPNLYAFSGKLWYLNKEFSIDEK